MAENRARVPAPCSMTPDLGWWGAMIAIVGGAIRVSTPYLYVSLGETLTEKSGRVNLGLEGTLVMGAMSGYAIAYLTGSPWLGVLVAGGIGAGFGLLHAAICNLPRVNDIAVGIALFLFGTGLAFFLGKPYIQPSAPDRKSTRLNSSHLGISYAVFCLNKNNDLTGCRVGRREQCEDKRDRGASERGEKGH